MGSSSSKPKAVAASESSRRSWSAASSSSGGGRRSRSKGKSRVLFQSSCLGAHDSDNDEQVKKDGAVRASAYQTKSYSADLDRVKSQCQGNVKVEEPDSMACVSSNVELNEWGQSRLSATVSRGGSTSLRLFSSRSLNPSSRFLSRFGFLPGNFSFRLSRTRSLGFSRSSPASSTSCTVSNVEEEIYPHIDPANARLDRTATPSDCDLLPACLNNRSPGLPHEDFTYLNPSSSGFSDNITSTQNVARDINNTRAEFNMSLRSPVSDTETEGIHTRVADRRIGTREPVERNVRFSRTLSVGRLRDRVLRRSSFPNLTSCPLEQERDLRDASQDSRRQALRAGAGVLASDENNLISSISYSPSTSSLYSSQDYEMETSRVREARYHDLLEHRSSFLERRRRIRSQVRALQRLGSRFENLPGHERSCILSGQHRRGHCTCRDSTRDANSNDDTTARASMSRIVLLAEALFEVLDEIHQQSVVLSRPSVSSIGSVPAPNEVVDSLPVKSYSNSIKHLNEETAQCYICLVEYEEGESVRVLPCHHEFHKSCVDKWLKEIHRICPLCRGDICRPESLPTEIQSS